MKQIREWLEKGGQDYAQGLALYEAHGPSAVVLKLLRGGPSDFTRQKLRQVLEKLTTAEPSPSVRAVDTSAERVRETSKREHVADPPAEDELRQRRSAWYAERNRLHAQLELVPTDEQRRVMAERILALSDLLTASYADSPAAVAAPRPDLASLTDQGEIRRLLANLRAHASKLKKNPARALDLQQARADILLLENKLLKP